MPSRRPTSVDLTPEVAAVLAAIGRPAAGRVRAALADPGRLDLAPRRRGEGGYRDARWTIRLSAAEIAAADALATEHGLSRDDLIARACEAVAGDETMKTHSLAHALESRRWRDMHYQTQADTAVAIAHTLLTDPADPLALVGVDDLDAFDADAARARLVELGHGDEDDATLDTVASAMVAKVEAVVRVRGWQR